RGSCHVLFAAYAAHLVLPSFPTRRSSDLQYPPRVHGAVRPDRVLIVANQAPCEPDGSDQRYLPADVTANATALFGVPPTWVPQRSEEHTSELQSRFDLVCRLLLEKKKQQR